MPDSVLGVSLDTFFWITVVWGVIWVGLCQEAGAIPALICTFGTCWLVGKFGLFAWIGALFGLAREAVFTKQFWGIVVFGFIGIGLLISLLNCPDVKWRKARNQQVTIQTQQPQLQTHQQVTWTRPPPGKVRMFHGTTKEAAWDIFFNNRFRVRLNLSLWITEAFDYAVSIANRCGDGLIVELLIDSDLVMIPEGGYNYRIEVPNGQQGKYYRFSGVVPVSIYDVNGNKIA
jgi:hypothetical protein